VPNGRRWSVSYTRRFTAVGLIAAAAFVSCVGAGMTNWAVVVLGAALFVLAISLVVVSAVRGGSRSFVRGTGHVIDATEPPSNVSVGRCELQIVVEAPGLAPAKVKIIDTRVPVAKWPDIGDTLPIRVAIDDPRHVRILWDEVRTHGEELAEEERFHQHVQRIVGLGAAEDEADAETLAAEAAQLVEAALVDERALADESIEAPGAAVGPPRSYPRPRPRPSPSPSPRPRPGPGPRQRRPSAAAATVVEPVLHIVVEDEVPVHDIVPIEGASAVLGVPPPERSGDHAASTPWTDVTATSRRADEAAVADLLAAYPSARPGAAGAIQGVGVTLIVTDLARSLAFYRDMLGFFVVDSGSSSAVLASGDTRIMLRAVSDMPKVDRRLVHLNLEVGDVEAVYHELRDKGVRFIHRPRPVARGQHMDLWAAAFRDPDGHGIALIRWQPRPA